MREGKEGDGVGIFVKELNFVEVKRCDHNDLQAPTIKTRADKQHYLITTCIHIPPGKENNLKFQRQENYIVTLPIDPQDNYILC